MRSTGWAASRLMPDPFLGPSFGLTILKISKKGTLKEGVWYKPTTRDSSLGPHGRRGADSGPGVVHSWEYWDH